MKKKLISVIMMLFVIFTSTAFANVNPVITTSTEREICLDVPQGKYVDDVYMVPVRRICEIFNASCDWYEEERMIVLNTPDNITRIFLYIERDTFRIFTFTGVISGDAQDLKLDAPLEIVNDRTLVPFEQICNALKGECVWSEDKTQVTVKVPEENLENRAEIYLTTDKEDVAAGEEIEITVMAKNTALIENYGLSGYSTGIIYDKTQFEYVSSVLTDAEGKTVETLLMENANFSADSSKAVCLAAVPFEHNNDEVKIGKIVLRALTDDGGEISLSNRVYTIGDDTLLVYMEKGGENLATINRGSMLNIHTEPIVIK